jgi:TonB-dependent receptor
MTGQYKNSLKLGAKYRGKDKQRDNDFYEYESSDEDAFDANALASMIDKTKDNFLAGNYSAGHFVSDEFLGTAALNDPNAFEKTEVLEELAGNFNASENVTSAYFLFRQNFGSKFKASVGLRMEMTQLEAQGFQYKIDTVFVDGDTEEIESLVQTQKETNDYINLLPNVSLKYDIDDNQIIRFAYTNSLARPDYYALVPFREVYIEDNELVIGNPDLTPTTSMNFDLMYENYFKSIGLLSGGVFYKDIQDFIVGTTLRDYSFEGKTWDLFEKTVNAGDANILGAELAFQRQLDFLPGALKGLGIYANYTYIYSKVKNFEIEGREGEELALPGTPENNLNGSINWDYKGFNIRVSANWTSAFRDSEGIGESAFYDRWYDQALYLDVNAYYAFAKHWKVFVDAINLTNQPLRYYQGNRDRLMQAEYYNARITAGVKFDLFVE